MKLLVHLCVLLAVSINSFAAVSPKRIITLSGALTETVAALGFTGNIVAVDVTSEYPLSIKKLPKVSRNRSLSVEGLMAYMPDMILAPEGDISRQIQYQLKTAGIQLVTVKQEFSVKGAQQLIRTVAVALQVPEKGEILARQTALAINKELSAIKQQQHRPLKVLFVYARGAGTMSVAGKGSNMDAMISLAGGNNAVQEFSDFKPYSTEAMIKANPDVILMFDFGVSSLGGRNAILQMPGVSLTNAGKNKRVVVMDGPLLVNFSVRLADAIRELHAVLFNPAA
jgi:iron complex transport system substrate-binding protein